MAELTDREKAAILDTLAELVAQVMGIKNALTRDQIVGAGSLNEHIEKARQTIQPGWPGWPESLPDLLTEHLRRGGSF